MKKSIFAAIGAAALIVPFYVRHDKKMHTLKLTALTYQARVNLVEKKLYLRFPGLVGRAVVDLTGKVTADEAPLFDDALDIVAERKRISAKTLARKLGVGMSCGEAFLDTMQDMGIVRLDNDGKYTVLMGREAIKEIWK